MSYLPGWASGTPRLISIDPSPKTEIVRWQLDRLGIPYREAYQVPVLHVAATLIAADTTDFPVLQVGETALSGPIAIFKYYEARTLESERLSSPNQIQAEEKEFEAFCTDFSFAVVLWAYYHLLPNRKSVLHVWTQRVGWLSGLLAFISYPLIALVMRRGWKITEANKEASLLKIDATFADVEKRLSDGRPYLFGERFSAADLAFAVNAAPLLLPENYGGPLPSLDSFPQEAQVHIKKWQGSCAGRWALDLYRTHRGVRSPMQLPEASFWSRLFNLLLGWTTPWAGNYLLRTAFDLLRSLTPFLRIGKKIIVSDFAQVTQVLGDDRTFSIAQINAKRMEDTVGPFVLGMDANDPRWRSEKELLNVAMGRQDLARIPAIAQSHARMLLDAARPLGRIDLVNGYARVAALRFVRTYFGVPGPNEPTLAQWMRTLFNELFLNIAGDKSVTRIARQSAQQLQPYLRNLIAERIAQNRCGFKPSDDVLGRLLAACPNGNLQANDEAVRRSISGLIIGAVDTTSAATTRVVDELLRRPDWMKKAVEAAVQNDLEAINGFVLEALRFNPHNPLQLRYCTRAYAFSPHRKVPAKSTVVAGTLGAMFDPNVFPSPHVFNPLRDHANYLHYGYGMHACQGRFVNGLQITTLIAELLKLKNLRRASSSDGYLLFDGPFPDRLILTFDPENQP